MGRRAYLPFTVKLKSPTGTETFEYEVLPGDGVSPPRVYRRTAAGLRRVRDIAVRGAVLEQLRRDLDGRQKAKDEAKVRARAAALKARSTPPVPLRRASLRWRLRQLWARVRAWIASRWAGLRARGSS